MEHAPNRCPASPARHRRGARTRLAAALLVGAALLGACSSDGGDAAPKATTTTEAPATTAAEATTTTTSGADDPDVTTTTELVEDADVDAWARNAQELEDQVGERFDVACPGPGVERTIWGTETYTTDSSICTAAVHVGLIDLEEGGDVTIEIAPGLDRYDAGIGNGITSQRFLAYVASFTFPDAPPGSGDFVVGRQSWSTSAATLGLEEGDEETVPCAPDGATSPIWGTETYTSDSSICTAAVHAGLLTVEDGGLVAIEVVAGQDGYQGSEANEVTSSDYGRYDLSFRFADQQPMQPGEVEGDPPVGDIEPTQLPDA